ncbi:MAG: hypothetical protein RL339_1040 [Pseudomonadota bacterium]
MHFDDRLATVLRLRAQGTALTRIQYRQLLDLLGTQPSEARGENVEAAYERLAELAATIPAADRAAMLRDRATRLRSPRLVAMLGADEPVLAEAAIDAARLEPAEWTDLLPALAPAAWARLGTRSDLGPILAEQLGRLGIMRPGLPPAEAIGASSAAATLDMPGPAPSEPVPEPDSIGAIVRRIEAYRKARAPENQGEAPRLPLGEDHVLHVPETARAFDFATNANGQIIWADPGVAPMVIGQTLAAPAAHSALTGALARRQPIAAARIELGGSPSIAGAWRIDASPRFDPLTGQFLGHQGRMRRWPAAAEAAAKTPESEADRIRQLLHELRTPVNAIQGFAEVIQQQLFGPTPHDYRALAAGIAGDAARMLSAFEELERLARLETAAMTLDPGEADVAEVLTATVAQLAAYTGQRGSGFTVSGPAAPCPVRLDRLEVERLAWRLLATLAGTAAPGERLELSIESPAGHPRIALALPAALAARSDKDLFEAGPGAIPQAIAAGVFGVGFALRLARAEAKAAGGQLERDGARLILTLPGLTAAPERHSDAG